MYRFIRLSLTALAGGLAAVAVTAPGSVSAASGPGTVYMKTIHAAHHGGGGGANLAYRGGSVETGPTRVYLDFWGSQWNSNDPSGEASLVESFLGHVGGSSWNNINSQYCQGTSVGSTLTPCGGTGTAVANASGMYGGAWYDNTTAAPSSPTQSGLAAEAAKASVHFGYSSLAEYVVLTATGDSQSGFQTSWCAYHSSTSATGGTIAWTYLPYITDAGSSCGANFNGLGANAGITIVEGHEMAESETDPFPSSGWLDSRGSEIGDKCAWASTTSSQSLNGTKYPVQPLWSNVSSGCVLSY